MPREDITARNVQTLKSYLFINTAIITARGTTLNNFHNVVKLKSEFQLITFASLLYGLIHKFCMLYM